MGWFAFSEPYAIATHLCVIPINDKLLASMLSDPRYRPDKYASYMIVNSIEDYRLNGVKYS